MSKRMNVLEKFNKMCDKLEGHEIKLLADILMALRGPDLESECEGDSLKGFTTTRIRSFIHSRFIDIGGMIGNRSAFNENQRMMRDELLSNAPNHFCNHYLRGVAAIAFLTGYNLWTECQLSDDDWVALQKGDHTVLGHPEIVRNNIVRYLPH